MATLTRPHEAGTGSPGGTRSSAQAPAASATAGRAAPRVHRASWLVLAAAALMLCYFAVQVTLVPQPRDYHLNWLGAQWITPADGATPAAYFRKDFTVAGQLSGAYLAVQGVQEFHLYVDGVAVGNTQDAVKRGIVNRAYLLDIAPLLKPGPNVVALCVVNEDNGPAALRSAIGLSYGQQTQHLTSDGLWRATVNPALAGEPCDQPEKYGWAQIPFDDAPWPGATLLPGTAPADGVTQANPQLYTQPLPTQWITAGTSSISSADAFFAGTVSLPSASEAWLRVAPNGGAVVYVNGAQIADQPAQSVDHRVEAPPNEDPNGFFIPWQAQWMVGMYDVTKYVHAGRNTIAVHVTASGVTTAQGTTAQPAALGLDLLAFGAGGSTTHLSADGSWRASGQAPVDWMDGGGVSAWPAAQVVDATTYVPIARLYRLATAYRQQAPGALAVQVVLVTLLLFGLAAALAVAAQCLAWRDARHWAPALDRVALALLPSLALFGLLFALTNETLLPRPFPYTGFWLKALVALAIISLALLLAMLLALRLAAAVLEPLRARARASLAALPRLTGGWRRWPRPAAVASGIALAVMLAAGTWLAFYNLGYEAYWQDEMQSINAAYGVLDTGVPRLLSGFVYPKAELYSYVLAAIIHFFGDSTTALRPLSALEYLACLGLTFYIGRYFFDRRVALLGVAILLFWPLELTWAREVRMYVQAQLFTLLVLYFFYRAVQPTAQVRYIYLSMVAVVLMYLSHEETFIILPAIAVYFFAVQRLRWVRNPHWWIAGLGAITIVLFQYFLTLVTHPPVLGTDVTNRPMVFLDPGTAWFYVRLMFFNGSMQGSFIRSHFGVTSLLSLVAAVMSLFSEHRGLRYLALFLVLPTLSLMFVFSLEADRYLYPILPIFALLSGYVIVRALDRLAQVARRVYSGVGARALIGAVSVLVVAASLASMLAPVAISDLAVARLLDAPYQHINPDYDAGAAYISAHWQPGDLLISMAPGVMVQYYAGLAPKYFLYENKALYLFDANNHIEDTSVGSEPLLNASDLEDALARYHRVWIYSDWTYECCGYPDAFGLPQNFTLVYQGRYVLVYFHGTTLTGTTARSPAASRGGGEHEIMGAATARAGGWVG